MGANGDRPRDGDVLVMVGTKRGTWLFWSDPNRRGWRRAQAHAGAATHAISHDPRDGRLYAAVNGADGARVERSDDLGATWRVAGGPLDGAAEVWQVRPGHASRPAELWAGAREASLHRSTDGGQSWRPVTGLNEHPTRNTWMPGGGGLILHTVLSDSDTADRVYACVSAGGAYRSDDGGASWRPINGGVRADFLEDAAEPTGQCQPETGQCVHKLVLHPGRPATLFQQNHCGVYRSDDRGERWVDISEGLPSRFGFPIAVHPHDPRSVYVVPLIADTDRTAPGGQLAVWRSRDDGASWRPLTSGLPRGDRLTALRESLATDDCESAGLYLGLTDGRVFHSRDGGDHWELLADDLPPVLSVEATRAVV
jgi:photosystem II stability/assembly factor-like uncharacterized protein